MTNPSEDLLATSEGVDEGSADSTAEGATSNEDLTGVTNPIKRALGDADRTDVQSEATPAPPVDTGTDGPSGPGQQLEAGEG
ncbi:hypothetical protein BH24ACT10_BH24ACT10_11040 [soil metagenome]